MSKLPVVVWSLFSLGRASLNGRPSNNQQCVCLHFLLPLKPAGGLNDYYSATLTADWTGLGDDDGDGDGGW